MPAQKSPHGPPQDLDHYKAYKIRNPESLIRQVQLQDQFDSIPENIDTLKQAYFLTPARKNNEPVYDTITHYVAYLIKPQRAISLSRTFIDQFMCDDMVIDTSKFLLVPTKKIAGPPPDTLRNHYKTWRIQPLPFDSTVFVQDQFRPDSGMFIRLESIDFLSNPAKKVVQNDTFNIIRPNDHLTWYRAESLAPLKKFKVEYVNQLESTSVWIDTLKYLLVPTRKFPHDQPESLDHYIGYRIEMVPSFVCQFQLQDQFDSIPEFIDRFLPIYFFTPARKNNEPVYDTITHYVAYEIHPQQSPFQPFWLIHNQFGYDSLEVLESKFLLVPTKKIAISLPPDTLRNHYKTWRIQPLPFDSTVFVQDQFYPDSGMFVRLESIDFLSNPAKKVVENDTFDIRRPDDHLTWYRAKSLAPLKKFEVDYVNQIESTSACIDTLKYLLVPTQKLPHEQPESLDYYIGYRIRPGPPSYFRQLQLQDQFDSIPELIDWLFPTYFFTPARKYNEPVYDTITHYVAYDIYSERFTPKTQQTTDQFGPHTMQIDTSKFLLVPTKKIAFRIPGDANGDGKVSVSDVVYLVNYLFKGGPLPIPELLVGDVNGDGKVTVSDVIYLINYLFKGGPPPGC